MTITVIGHGYVGLVTACVFADLGNTVYVIGRSKEKISKLQKGDSMIFEPGLQEILKNNLAKKRLVFTTDYSPAVSSSSIIFIAVGTPSKNDGQADLSSVEDVAEKIGRYINQKYSIICCKSTVPVGTNKKIKNIILKNLSNKNYDIDIASCPEFLREGTALNDTFSPDRVIIGSDSKKAIQALLKLHKPLGGKRVIVGLESAELIKYASNSLLATKISFANLISLLCEKTGANVEEVLAGVGLDHRIGNKFLNPGIGYGGSCFPKDVKALISTGNKLDIDTSLLKSVDDVNLLVKENFIAKTLAHVPKGHIGIWGLSFKPNTDDIRDAPSLFIIEKLLSKKYTISVYDPEASDNVKKIIGKNITYANSPYEAVKDKDALLILTEWNEFKQIDLIRVKKLMKNPIVFDGRNIYDPKVMKKLGFNYYSIGR